MNKKLTFGDLEIGDRFIDFPTDGDQCHGGYMGAYNVFIKFSKAKITMHSLLQYNAINTVNGALSHIPDKMHVIKINN